MNIQVTLLIKPETFSHFLYRERNYTPEKNSQTRHDRDFFALVAPLSPLGPY